MECHGFCCRNLAEKFHYELGPCSRRQTLGYTRNKSTIHVAIPKDPITLSDDEQGVYNHLLSKVFFGSITILRFGDWILRV